MLHLDIAFGLVSLSSSPSYTEVCFFRLFVTLHLIIPMWSFHLVYYIDRLVQKFFKHFNKHYEAALAIDFTKLDLVNQMDFLKLIYKVLCIIFCTTTTTVVMKPSHIHILLLSYC